MGRASQLPATRYSLAAAFYSLPQKKRISDTRIEDVLAMRRDGSTLIEIGAKYGLTRERIRQLLAPFGARELRGKTQQEMAKEQAEAREAFRVHFARRMKEWLWSIGYRRCAVCKLWDVSVTVSLRRCRRCNRDAVNERRRDPNTGYAEYLKRYRREHPEVQKDALKRWHEKNPDYASVASRRRYEKLRSTPEGRERLNERERKSYAKRMADPAYRKQHNAKRMARYYAKKSKLEGK